MDNSFLFNPLNSELDLICHLLALFGAHHIFHVSGLGVNTFSGVKHNFIGCTLRLVSFGKKIYTSKEWSSNVFL